MDWNEMIGHGLGVDEIQNLFYLSATDSDGRGMKSQLEGMTFDMISHTGKTRDGNFV
jgi:hypothetical protein